MLRNPSALRVSMEFAPDNAVPVGRLAFDGNVGVFEYDAAFIGSGLILSPFFSAPSRELVRAAEPRLFAGLPGVFADSLPDAYGELLLRRRAAAEGINYAALTSLQKLSLIGRRGPGALVYQPAVSTPYDDSVDLDVLAHEAAEVLEGGGSDVLPILERLGGSSGGARPKVLVAMNDEGHVVSGIDHIQPGFTAWIVKFRSSADIPEIGPLEAAYADMARAAGLTVPSTRLISTARGPGYFATRRFDRGPGNVRIHMLSVAGMLELDWQGATIDYKGLLNVTRRITRGENEVMMMFRRMVFNVLAHNRDDHTKQHAFLMDRSGAWKLAPAYDLTFSHGPAGEHYLPIDGAVKDVRKQHILGVARTQGLSPKRAEHIVEEVAEAVHRFDAFASTYGVSIATTRKVASALKQTVSLAL